MRYQTGRHRGERRVGRTVPHPAVLAVDQPPRLGAEQRGHDDADHQGDRRRVQSELWIKESCEERTDQHDGEIRHAPALRRRGSVGLGTATEPLPPRGFDALVMLVERGVEQLRGKHQQQDQQRGQQEVLTDMSRVSERFRRHLYRRRYCRTPTGFNRGGRRQLTG
jgi:hypothetical protein